MDSFAVATRLDPTAGYDGRADRLMEDLSDVLTGFDQLDMPLMSPCPILSVVEFGTVRFQPAMDLAITQRTPPQSAAQPRPLCQELTGTPQSLHSQTRPCRLRYDFLPTGLAERRALIRPCRESARTSPHTISLCEPL